MTEDAETVYILYRNHRGITAWRRILPLGAGFYATQWHDKVQWMLRAIDLDKDAKRDFAMKDILEWRTSPPETISPQPTEPALDVGDLVRAATNFVLRSGSGVYDSAVVVSLSPFVLVSVAGDMLWRATVTPERVVRIGKAPSPQEAFRRWRNETGAR